MGQPSVERKSSVLGLRTTLCIAMESHQDVCGITMIAERMKTALLNIPYPVLNLLMGSLSSVPILKMDGWLMHVLVKAIEVGNNIALAKNMF